MNAEQSTAFREGHTLGQLHCAQGRYRPGVVKCEEERLGYEAGWDAAFFAKVKERSRSGELNFKSNN
jgi:hypothetical protein